MASGSPPGLGFVPTSESTEEETTSDFFGWDLLYKTVERVVNKKTDVIIALAHFILVKHYQMKCVGVGEGKTLTEDDTGSELLPDGWNDGDKRYSLRYVHNGELYLLIANTAEDFITMNLLDVKETNVSNLTLNPESVVTQIRGTIFQMIPEVSSVVSRFRLELVDSIFTGNTREVTTQTLGVQDSRHQQNGRYPQPAGGPMQPTGSWHIGPPLPFGFPNVGRGDLDPLGGGGPGNLFPTPTHPDFEGMNPRTDPYGPDRNTRQDPNPDHLPPPNSDHGFYM